MIHNIISFAKLDLVYKSVTLPSLFEIERKQIDLLRKKYKNKKGKLIKRLNKHSKSSFKTRKTFFVEDSILIYNRLAENGL
jgi:hypothetical protein